MRYTAAEARALRDDAYPAPWDVDLVSDEMTPDRRKATCRLCAAAPDLATQLADALDALEAAEKRVAELAADVDDLTINMDADLKTMIRERHALRVAETALATLQAYLDTLPETPTAAELDAICAIAHGRLDHPLVIAALTGDKP